MKKHPIAALEVLNRRRLVRRNFLTDYLGGNEQNRRKEVSDLASMEYLTCYPPDGNGTLERSYPRQFFRIYGKGLKADRALKAAGIEPIKHPDIGEQFWHQMLIDDIVMSFEIACRQQGLPFTDQYEILGDQPLELPCHISFTFPSSGKTHTSDKDLCPDALFAIGETYFALEADRGTEPIERSNLNQTSYLRKFLQYADVLKTGRYKTAWQITLFDGIVPIKHYFDTDTGGTPALRQKSTRQRREAVAHDVYRAVCDVERMNKVFPDDPQLNFYLEFTDDVAELRAAETDRGDDEAAVG
jgi:hypothetical protein